MCVYKDTYFSRGKPLGEQLAVLSQLMKMLWRTLANQMCMLCIQGVPKQVWGEGNELWMFHGKCHRAAVMKLGAFVLLSLSADLFCSCPEPFPIGNWNQNVGQQLEGRTEKWKILNKQMAAFENTWICTCVHRCSIIFRQISWKIFLQMFFKT